jgi:hypothetical protein
MSEHEARVLGFGPGKVHVQGLFVERKMIAHNAILNLGNIKEPMTMNLAQAESGTLTSA